MVLDNKPLLSDRFNHLIKVKQEQITPQIKTPTKIDFYLTDRDLAEISQRQKSPKRLPLSPELLGDLRIYSLGQNPHFSQLVFTTYHVRESEQIAVIKSKISLSGKISQQIYRAYLNEPQLLNILIVNHYWLIGKICDRLPLRYKNRQLQLTRILALGFTILLAPVVFLVIPLNWVFKLLISIAIGFCLQLVLGLLIKKYLARFLWQQLLFGFFAKNTSTRRLGWLLVRYFS